MYAMNKLNIVAIVKNVYVKLNLYVIVDIVQMIVVNLLVNIVMNVDIVFTIVVIVKQCVKNVVALERNNGLIVILKMVRII
jgi:hypothetical protein